MLSNEEREAIEYIENCLDDEYDYKNATRQKDKKAHNIILNLIKKQSKEIEELKDTRSIFNMGRRSYKNEIEDKIKAKIEYYEKIDNPVGKRVLESLLKKE